MLWLFRCLSCLSIASFRWLPKLPLEMEESEWVYSMHSCASLPQIPVLSYFFGSTKAKRGGTCRNSQVGRAAVACNSCLQASHRPDQMGLQMNKDIVILLLFVQYSTTFGSCGSCQYNNANLNRCVSIAFASWFVTLAQCPKLWHCAGILHSILGPPYKRHVNVSSLIWCMGEVVFF